MSVKSIRESTGKDLLNRFLPQATGFVPSPFVLVDEKTNLCELTDEHAWLLTDPLQVKPDQLIRDQDTLGLVKQDTDFAGVCQFIKDHMLKTVNVCSSVGKLRNFIIESFIKHEGKEVNLSINSHRSGDTIRLEALNLEVSIEESLDIDNVKRALLINSPMKSQDCVAKFIVDLYRVFVELYFTNLEISLLLLANKDSIHISKLSAKLDGTAEYLCKSKWGQIDFPPPFGRDALPEEAAIVDLDSRSGASLKFTVLNRNGRIWTMVAGGGASVIYADTICQLGGAAELANYGEYSGAPSEQQTYEYARTILSLMCTNSERHSEGKILLIGGCIANFTNVAATFKGIVKALIEYRNQLIEHQVTIYCRRAGPNYQEGLQLMRDTGASLGIPVHVFGPETHMTAIVTMALKPHEVPKLPEPKLTTANLVLPRLSQSSPLASSSETPILGSEKHPLFTNQTKAIVWGMQNRAVQSTIDFDFACSRTEWSVVAMVYPFSGDHKQKFYWGSKEILIPVYKNMSDAMLNHPDADVMISFASLRSAYDSTLETLKYPQIRTIAIIAEGIPQNLTRKLIVQARQKGVTIIGPATVGGIKAGCFKIGNSGGMMDNLLSSRLYRPGSVGYVSRSGGMSNELNNIIARSTNGVCEGIAIGGDRYPGSTFLEHFLRYERDPQIKMLVLLGEVGGVGEYEVCEAIKDGRITKPLVAWCIGTCASLFSSDFQFGHAGACANSERETATAKNESLRQYGALVPDSFDDLGSTINKLYQQLVDQNVIIPKAEVIPPTVPIDYAWARELGLIRKSTSFTTSICDERGNELTYAGIPISRVIKEDLGIGGTLSLLWFQRRLPTYATKFFEMVLMITADHGPAVSGAHNTIVCSRAGKDLISSLVSGLLTIGDRFGGALDASARQFSQAYDSNTSPHEFVNQMRQKGQLIMGIGHRVKSLNNPDMRVQLMKDYVKQTFPDTPILDYALQVEKVTTAKKSNLILNVDGVVAVSVVDLLRNCGCFTSEEAQEYLDIGVLNGLFVLGRSIGFIGHYFDQKRLKQQLYRHPWDDISYILPEPDK